METYHPCEHSNNPNGCDSCRFIIDQGNLSRQNLTGSEALILGFKLKLSRKELEQRRKEMEADFRTKRELEKMPRSHPINIPPRKLNF